MNNKTNPQKWNLEERIAKFEENIIRFYKKIPKNPITIPLITQLVKAGTSVGVNYYEDDDAESKKDFRHKIGIVKKESGESKHFIRMVVSAVPELNDDARPL